MATTKRKDWKVRLKTIETQGNEGGGKKIAVNFLSDENRLRPKIRIPSSIRREGDNSCDGEWS